ncbi:Reverse transcriptase, RNA-dependent DNA polymerase [Corchorus capsularis]|uniref:Reverse transcriptase, RNA-dependent DNA polymerase n=1 Tax=Corchorus capsularis TaxID=210143 RepID=A0A1R3GTB0_COCAP|nr:Reverse transcriptase, RNA-dependent DNA polymerase [Corchorus capsularis]
MVEPGLLYHAKLPSKFWTLAFQTDVYLINMLSTHVLNNHSPFQLLFKPYLNYSKLRVFGYLCYPWLRPYSKNKLDFVGYSDHQSAYKCFDFTANKFYTSRHVVFVENEFSFPSSSIASDLRHKDSSFLSVSPNLIQLQTSPTSSMQQAPQLLAPNVSAQPLVSSSLDFPTVNSSPVFLAIIDSLDFPVASTDMAPSLPTASHSAPSDTAADCGNSSMIGSAKNIVLASSTVGTAKGHVIVHKHVANAHPMKTRSKDIIFKPKSVQLTTKHPLSVPLEPTSVSQALKEESWRKAMSEELNALLRNGTWELAPPTSSQNVIGCKWVFKLKRNPDVSISRHKAKSVAKGFNQRPGVDFSETFSPVVKPTTTSSLFGCT